MGINTPDVPDKPSDRYAVARRVLHVVAVLITIGGNLWLILWPWADATDWSLPWPWWGIAAGACETAAFALRTRGADAEATDGMEAGLRIGCGAFVGFFAGIFWALTHWSGKHAGTVYIASAVVGAVVFGALSLRFGDKFWNSTKPF